MNRHARENLRQGAHLGMGLSALLLRYLSPNGALVLAGAALAHNLLLLPLYAKLLWREAEERRGFATGVVLYPAVLLASALLFRERLHLAAAVWALLAFGDGSATLLGRTLGGPRLPWNPAKTWVGSAAHFLIGGAAAGWLLWFVSARYADGALSPLHAGGLAAGAALAAAAAESAPWRLDDNLTAPVAATAALTAGAAVRPELLAAAGPELAARLPWALGINAVLAVLAVGGRVVTASGTGVGFVLAVTLWVFAGPAALALLAALVALGAGSTWLGTARPGWGRRGASHALANAGIGTAFAVLAAGSPRPELQRLALVGAFATAACDTVATEIGQAWGRRPVLVTSFRRVVPGTAGAVSLPGTAGGLVAAAIVTGIAVAGGLVPLRLAWLPIAGALLGATLDSLLSATAERRGLLGHQAVNLLNTATGALLCLAVGSRMGG